MNDITVLIVDDHPVVRHGLCSMISLEPDMQVVGEAGSGAEALDLHTALRPDIVLVDLLLPDLDGASVIARICEKQADTNAIVVTTLCGEADIYRALEAGARGYLFKDAVRKELALAIRTVHEGGRYVAPQVGARLAESLPRQTLSAREVEVLKLVATGQRNKEIAFHLSIAEATVNAHLKHILEKLGASDRTQAVTSALRRGIIRL